MLGRPLVIGRLHDPTIFHISRRWWRHRIGPALAILGIQSLPETFVEVLFLIRWSSQKAALRVPGRSFHEKTKCYRQSSHMNLLMLPWQDLLCSSKEGVA